MVLHQALCTARLIDKIAVFCYIKASKCNIHMADNFSKSPERVKNGSPEKKHEASPQDSKEIKDLSKGFGVEAVEFAEDSENGEVSDEKVSEEIKEDKKKGI